ncbi:MAG: DNA-directed RNA polymerase subunit beta' [Planctomycetes bacterium]|nr:DNA-directed RNA polymerase subunit beta' [Planctomycetota bacterium]
MIFEEEENAVSDFDSVSIGLVSPNDIRSWSHGEVKKPETINYRTYRCEKDGLFCEKIFGPEKDYECFCGKYKGIKYRNIVCDRCNVKITSSRVRRERMGHINLAAPVVHIWFYKVNPSRIGMILDIKASDLQQVIYFQKYLVTDTQVPVGHEDFNELCLGSVLTEDRYREFRRKDPNIFKAEMGAEAVRSLLKKTNLGNLLSDIEAAFSKTRSVQTKEHLMKRKRVVKAFLDSQNDPCWMILDVVPVIPAELRPLVPLESGNFATSDLNDLYRRVISRNNRLKKLVDLNAPEVIIRNEKRMLQQAVDSLFDNGRSKRPVVGTNQRPLKSLTDMLKGKSGRFRENLLGKRVDYSARSVIVVGPHLKLHQCGLPKKIALELFQPFIIRRLREKGLADTIRSAKKILERRDRYENTELWDILDEVTQNHPVMLNRAPTLHRLGFQAFMPVLVEGDAIQLHPLVCRGFNADFDGDTMSVHLPLSRESVREATEYMLSTNNVFSPANGAPIISPSLDIVLGTYYLTYIREEDIGRKDVIHFPNKEAVYLAQGEGKLTLHSAIRLRMPKRVIGIDEGEPGRVITTTVGRIMFNDILDARMPYYNTLMSGKALNSLISDCYGMVGIQDAVELLDRLKELGFTFATRSGVSFGHEDLKVNSNKKEVLERAEKQVLAITRKYNRGVITNGERYNQIIDIWTHSTQEISDDLLKAFKNDVRDGKKYLNPIYIMSDSGARGNPVQIRQLAGMRGLMSKPNGAVIEVPIKASFREGLSTSEYFSSTHGARKGLADTALKTAESGYLTRKLVEVAQDVIIFEEDCGTLKGITKEVIYKGEHVEVPLRDLIKGRVARDNIVDLVTSELIVKENEIITLEMAKKIEGMQEKIRIRSPLTCESKFGLCQKCYGLDLSNNKVVAMGVAAGIIAAQSIGEPGTQLTMRTFHLGGTASRTVAASNVRTKNDGFIKFRNLKTVTNDEGQILALNRNGEILVIDAKGRELESHSVTPGAVIFHKDGEEVKNKALLMQWELYFSPIICEVKGKIVFDGLKKDVTFKEEIDPQTGITKKVITEHKADLHPQIIVQDEDGANLRVYSIPEGAHLEINEGDTITPGSFVAKTPRELGRTMDITGGIPRVTELLEVRKPKQVAMMSEISGIVEIGDKKRGKRAVTVVSPTGERIEYLVPLGKHLRVQTGDMIRAGEALIEGSLDLHELLNIRGLEYVQRYLIDEIQNVYRYQSVPIDDKHFEIIISRMFRKVQIMDFGDSGFLTDMVDRIKLEMRNKELLAEGKRPATSRQMLMGITKAGLMAESFIAASSFQETTKVLTEAAIAGKVDYLLGLKENVILGHKIPAGTGFHGKEVKIDLEAESFFALM